MKTSKMPIGPVRVECQFPGDRFLPVPDVMDIANDKTAL
jgi:hypothetical protein